MQRALSLTIALLCSAAAPAFAQSCADRSNDYAARITLCDQAFADAADNDAAAYALALKGEAQRMLGDYDAAHQTLTDALSYTPENSWVWVELGNIEYNRNNIPGSVAYYSAALAVDDYVDAYANRADSWWSMHNPKHCSEDADQALRLDAKLAYANDVKGRCLVDLDQADQALSYFDTALSIDPTYQSVYRNKISALLDLGRYADAIVVADLALKPGTVPNPDASTDEQIQSMRLLALANTSPPNMVVAEADALLARFPLNYAATNIKAMALLGDGKAQDADTVSQVLRQNTDGTGMEGAYYDTLAQIDIALGRLDQAYGNFESAMDFDASLSKVYAKKLSELGFLPLSNSPAGVLTALRRCIDVKKTACTVAG